MSSRSSSGSDTFSDIEELLEIGTRCRELRKEKDMLRGSQSQSFELIRRLELHVKTLSEARADNEKRIQELERELKNCFEEIDYLQDQLNARNEEVCCLSERVHSLELKVTDVDSLEEKVGRLTEELNWSNAERLILIKELESKDVEFQNSASCIEKLEESISSVALEYQCEIESMRLDLMALEQSSFEAKKFQEETAQETTRMNWLIQDLELQIQNERKNTESLNKENDDLREKLDESEINSRIFCQKIEEQFDRWLEMKDGSQLNSESLSRVLERDISTCGDILGPLLSRQAVLGVTDADFKDKMDIMSRQIHGYEVLVKQLKEEVKTEKLKAKEEAEDVAQEMAELRYQITGLLEEERKRRACIEQISLQRISELEAQIKKDRRKRISSVRLIHEA
ncbi:ELKS/Rab6-interacting/CAST family member 1 like [Actinidia chinensis var. chinensis]|uniref:ELKS/Rab6-interacting/CAST family member 1 like n=1 Tax=Actinidia chinensis var. chinensis TaxID=1590841 RepID=A0A2R6PCU3_ACTCC|nr:ELKS/Rab6-interacting/CAST family member 1 like [Actinidia chinensis var. chinensis]